MGSGLRFAILLDRCWSGGVAPTRIRGAMARKARAEVEGGLYHVITRGNNRQTIFKCKDDFQKFLSQLEIQKHIVALPSCVLPDVNHVHLLI